MPRKRKPQPWDARPDAAPEPCYWCSEPCDGRFMRFNKAASSGTLAMLTAVEVPKRADGAIGICPDCQRRMFFAGGLIPFMARNLAYLARMGRFHPMGGR